MANIIRFMSEMTVQAPTESDLTVDLTPWDLQLLLVGPIQQGFLFHRPSKFSSSSSFIRHLHTSLSRTLRFFPPLAGRLSRTDYDNTATASFSIHCNNAGAELIHAAADSISLSDVLDAVYVPPFVRSFFPLNGTANIQGVTHPLLAVQVTELADGAVFIGCTANHAVVDGSSFWHFLKCWSEISRGVGSISKAPSLERWFVSGSARPLHVPVVQLQLNQDEDEEDDDARTALERIFRISKERIAELKAKANVEMGTDQISSLQAVLAYFWKSVIRRLGLDGGEEVYFVLAIGGRSRLQRPPLPEEYFGNAFQIGTLKMTTGELLGHGIGHAAWEMKKVVASHTQEMIESFLNYWSQNPFMMPIASNTRNNFMAATNSPRFKVYDTDFGWGRPLAIRGGASNKYSGKLVLYPSGVQEGGFEIRACFLPHIFYALEKDSEFMDIFG